MSDSKPYQLPTAPEGTTLIIRSRSLPAHGGPDDTELKVVGPDASGSYNVFAPLQFFAAFDAAGNHLGSWSPAYPDFGWAQYRDGYSPGEAEQNLFTLKRFAQESPELGRKWERLLNGQTVVI